MRMDLKEGDIVNKDQLENFEKNWECEDDLKVDEDDESRRIFKNSEKYVIVRSVLQYDDQDSTHHLYVIEKVSLR